MRLPILTADQLTPQQRELSDRITQRRGQTRGPYAVWLHSPNMGDRAEQLAAYARFECSLSKKLRELCICVTARFWDAQYSWNAHVDVAIDAGMHRDTMQAIAARRPPKFYADDERIFFTFAMELLENHFVSDKTYQEAHAMFGNEGMVDLLGCIGNFSMLGMLLNAFEVDLQANREPPYPDIRGYERIKALQRAV